ncbi:MAG: membrane integrity-associated transporter subunit PqiC [Telmatospirillum sp.]|nr:membrane integrity-associated transporter subunit PqiC [Telmatospirillum sp.]
MSVLPHTTTRRKFLKLASLAAIGTAAGCQLPGSGEPPQLFTLTPKSTFAGDLPRADWQLAVEMPVASGGIDTSRIALARSPVTLDYFARANWTDTAPRMVQTLLVESFENTGRIVAVGRESSSLRPDYLLKVDLREFQAELRAGAPPAARVRLAVRLVRLPERTVVASFAHEARQPSVNSDIHNIVLAFDEALGTAMRRVVEWTLRTAEPRRA